MDGQDGGIPAIGQAMRVLLQINAAVEIGRFSRVLAQREENLKPVVSRMEFVGVSRVLPDEIIV